MTIMIVFVILTIFLIIVTAIYLSQKQNNSTKPLTTSEEVKEESRGKSKKQLSDILEIKVKDNIICLGNRYSIIVKLGSIDYNILSEDEKGTVENILIQTALTINYPIQFFSTTEYIDTTQIIDYMKTSDVNNAKVKEYKKYLMGYLDNLMENRNISIIKNYAIISYDGTYDKATEELNRQVASFIGNLRGAKIVCAILSEIELYGLLYRELNKNSAMKINNLIKGGLYVGKKQKTERN